MQKTEIRWNKPQLKAIGTLRDVAGQGAGADQSKGNAQGTGNGKS